MVTPVWEHACLDFFVEARLHPVHVFKLVSGDSLVLTFVAASDGFLECAGSADRSTTLSIRSSISFCHLINRLFN